MNIEILKISGLSALAGAFLYAIGDVLLLARLSRMITCSFIRDWTESARFNFACTTITLWNV